MSLLLLEILGRGEDVLLVGLGGLEAGSGLQLPLQSGGDTGQLGFITHVF